MIKCDYIRNGGVIVLTRESLAEELKVHPNTIDKWRKKGMPEVRVGKTVRFELEEVKKWMKGGK